MRRYSQLTIERLAYLSGADPQSNPTEIASPPLDDPGRPGKGLPPRVPAGGDLSPRASSCAA